MVFPHGHPSRKKKSKIRYQDKKGNSYSDNRTAVAAAREDVGATANDTDSANPVPQHPAKIPQAGKNWTDNYQVQRALNYRDNKVAKLLFESNDLSKKNEYLKGTVHEQKSTIKDLTHQMHIDAKSNCTAAVQAEDAHQADLAAIAEEFASEIEEAYVVANTDIEKSWRLRSAAFLQTEST